MTIGVYCIEHVSSGKCYVGKSINIERRLASHKYWLTRKEMSKTHCNRYLYNAVQKHGWDAFDCYVLQEFPVVDEEVIAVSELFWMEWLNSTERNFGYNLRMDSSTKMIVHDETRVLLREVSTGERNPNYGNYWTERQKKRMSQIALKRHGSGLYGQEWRDKISRASTELWKDESKRKAMAENVSKAKEKYRFHQYSREGKLIKTWGSVKEIIEENPGYKWQNIYSVCNGYKKTYMGYKWVKEIKI